MHLLTKDDTIVYNIHKGVTIMANNTATPIDAYIIEASHKKYNKKTSKLFLQGLLAGLYIALGAIGYFKVVGATQDPGLGVFLGAAVFPLGIIAVLAMKAELFTSDTMSLSTFYTGDTGLIKPLRVLTLVFIANFIGAFFIAFLSYAAEIYSPEVLELIAHKADHKVQMPIIQLITSGILCNVIVCTGMCMAYNAKTEIGQFAYAWLAIAVFVLSGTEHVVANMYYLMTAYLTHASISLSQIGYNLLFVMVGNVIGGGIFVAGINILIGRNKA